MFIKRVKIAVLALMCCFVALESTFAQQNGANASSPFTLYGFGQVNTLGTARDKSMAGAGLAVKSRTSMSALNPAGLSAVPQQTFLVDFGVQGENNYIDHKGSKTSANRLNISDLGFQFPIAQRLGFGVIMNPYSSVGYDISLDKPLDDIGGTSYNYQGSGGVTLIKAGLGWEPIKGFSIGVNSLFYHGSIQRDIAAGVNDITNATIAYSSLYQSELYQFTKVNAEIGVIYSYPIDTRRSFNVGVTFQPKATINVDETRRLETTNNINTVTIVDTMSVSQLVLPNRFSAGVAYTTEKLTLALDYVYQDYTDMFRLNDSGGINGITLTTYQDLKLGLSYTPNRMNYGNAFQRWTYRMGVRYGTTYLAQNGSPVKDYSVVLGAGIPLQKGGPSLLNVGFDGGQRSTFTSNSMVESYLKLYIGVDIMVLHEWFVRHKFK